MATPTDGSEIPTLKILNKKDYVDYNKFKNFNDSENRLTLANHLSVETE